MLFLETSTKISLDCFSYFLNTESRFGNEVFFISAIIQIIFTIFIMGIPLIRNSLTLFKKRKSHFDMSHNEKRVGLKYKYRNSTLTFLKDLVNCLSKQYSLESLVFITLYIFYDDLIYGLGRSLLIYSFHENFGLSFFRNISFH